MLIANKGLNGEHMMWAFIRNWKREPWRGYGNREAVLQALKRLNRRHTHSNSNPRSPSALARLEKKEFIR